MEKEVDRGVGVVGDEEWCWEQRASGSNNWTARMRVAGGDVS